MNLFLVSMILSDIKMPTMTGIELLGKVREIDMDIPVALITGFASTDNLIEAIKKGIYGVVEKPFKAEHVLPMVDNAVASYRQLKLFERSMNLLIYQYSDLDDYLKEAGKEDVRNVLRSEVKKLMDEKRKLKAQKEKSLKAQ